MQKYSLQFDQSPEQEIDTIEKKRVPDYFL